MPTPQPTPFSADAHRRAGDGNRASRGVRAASHRWLMIAMLACVPLGSSGCIAELDAESQLGDDGAGGPDGGGDGPAVDVALCSLPGKRIVKLTPKQYFYTVQPYLTWMNGNYDPSKDWRSTVGSHQGRFSNDANRLDMSDIHVARISEGSSVLATKQGAALYAYMDEQFKNPAQFGCKSEDPTVECARGFLEHYMPRVWRRPLRAGELDRYVGFFEAQTAKYGSVLGLAQALRAVYMSPFMLYRTEIGEPDAKPNADSAVELTPYEKAQAISYFVTDRPPDAEMQKALADEKFKTNEQIAAHTKRLVALVPETDEYGNTKGAEGLSRFWEEYLKFTLVKNKDKGWRYGPEWNSTGAQATASEETKRFIQHWFWKDDARVSTLMSANYTFVNAPLAKVYGIDGPADKDTWLKVELPPERRGLLTQASFLAGYGKEWSPDIVHRGLYIRTTLLCGTVPPVPANVPSAGVLVDDPEATHSQIVEQHSKDPSCWTCHQKMDPLGRPFQSYDTIGRYRTVDTDQSFAHDDDKKERPLGSLAGEIMDTYSSDAEVKDALDLISKLAESRDVARCVAANLYKYAQARVDTKADGCALADHYDAFLEDEGDARDFIVSITTAKDFNFRKVE